MKVQRHLASLLRKNKPSARASVERAEPSWSGQAVTVSAAEPAQPSTWPRQYGLPVLYLALLACLLYLNQQLWLSDERGLRDVEHLQASVAAQQRLNASLLARNEQLRYEVISLKQGADALEERARVDLGMIREGETLIQLIPADSN